MGLIHLDAGVIIGFLDATDAHHESARRFLGDVVRSGERLAMAASAFAECLVGPARRGQHALDTIDELFARVPIDIVHLDAETSRVAAVLRAEHPSLRLPDALVIATAVNSSADRLVTTDTRWPSARRLQVTTAITVL